ncbi:MAG: hypothetical protein A3J28_07620 [Acidobacteria bacterium RIFCSPLOWO2_12_FULL_60_22]|nr:MAG: hypothetical protein A3J28_07620 [Acidobacteria bacterium RIFCSPLOWO2_12_FULL_60_22]
MKKLAASLADHYSQGPTLETISEDLQRKGIDLARVRPEDLYPYDQSHAGGITTTRMLARLAAIQTNTSVVDIGCGIGGAARFLHAEFGCRVVGIDLTVTRLRTAVALNRLIGNPAGIHIVAAQADSLPLPSNFADVVWTQHLTMNLPDPRGFLRECARVLRPTGRLALHEWFVNRLGSLSYPLPWAANPSLNFALRAERFLELLREQNFSLQYEDVTPAMADRLQKDIQVLVSRNGPVERIAALENLVRAATDGLLCCWMVIADR